MKVRHGRPLAIGVTLVALALATSSTPMSASAQSTQPEETTTPAFALAATKDAAGDEVEPQAIPALLAAGRVLVGTSVFRNAVGNATRQAGGIGQLVGLAAVEPESSLPVAAEVVFD